jgi:hypothetical protein
LRRSSRSQRVEIRELVRHDNVHAVQANHDARVSGTVWKRAPGPSPARRTEANRERRVP